jgi:hypothetical protein
MAMMEIHHDQAGIVKVSGVPKARAYNVLQRLNEIPPFHILPPANDMLAALGMQEVVKNLAFEARSMRWRTRM